MPKNPQDQGPPRDENAERSVLGAILISAAVLQRVAMLLRPESFYRAAHRLIFAVMLALHGAGEPIDTISVVSELERRGELERAGGSGAIHDLTEVVPTAMHAEHYAKLVRRAWQNRLIGEACERGKAAAWSNGDPDAAIATVQKPLQEVQMERHGDVVTPVRKLGERFLERVDAQIREGGASRSVVPTGTAFDGEFGGLPRGLTILSGRTGEGKTTLAAWWATTMAQFGPVVFVTMEVDAEELFERMEAIVGEVRSEIFRSGPFETLRAAYPRISKGVERFHHLPIWVMHHAEPTTSEIAAVVRLVEDAEQQIIHVLIGDRLELLKVPGQVRMDEYVRATRASRLVKRLNIELGRPVLFLAQMNQDFKRRETSRPELTDLLGSGAIKNDAQMVLFVQREGYSEDEAKAGPARIWVRKNNAGPTGSVPVRWEPDYPRFVDTPRAVRVQVPVAAAAPKPIDDDLPVLTAAEFQEVFPL